MSWTPGFEIPEPNSDGLETQDFESDRVAKAGDTMTGTLTMQDADIQINDPPGGATRGVQVSWSNLESYMTGFGLGNEQLTSDDGAGVSYWGVSAWTGDGEWYAEMLQGSVYVYGEWATNQMRGPFVGAGGAVTQAVTWTRSGTTITCTTPLPHNFYPAEYGITISGSSDVAALPNGSKTIVAAPTLTTFTITGLDAGATSGTATYSKTSANELFTLAYDGKFYFGPQPLGVSATPDVNLYRGNPNVLRTDDEFQAGEDVRAGEATKNGTDGLILYSPDGTAYRVTVQNGGTLSVAAA